MACAAFEPRRGARPPPRYVKQAMRSCPEYGTGFAVGNVHEHGEFLLVELFVFAMIVQWVS